MFVPEFEEAMNSLAPGQIADPVVSRFGVHLIQVLERRQATLERSASSASWRATCCARRSSTKPTCSGRRTCAAAPTSSCASRRNETAWARGALREAHPPQALRPALPGRPAASSMRSCARSIRGPARRWSRSGPGLGALTQPLVERLGKLTVIELDRDLAARLRGHAQLDVIEADVLKVDFARWRSRWACRKAAGGRQPALQHLHADPVPPAGLRGQHRGPALHAAEGSGRPHGGARRRPATTAGCR